MGPNKTALGINIITTQEHIPCDHNSTTCRQHRKMRRKTFGPHCATSLLHKSYYLFKFGPAEAGANSSLSIYTYPMPPNLPVVVGVYPSEAIHGRPEEDPL